MANTANVTAGKPAIGGAVSVAPTTATLPTDATTSLSGFANLGYVSDEGVTHSITRDSEDIKAWGGDTVLTLQTSFAETFQMKLIEAMNTDVMKVVFGDDNVSGALATGITTIVNSKELPAHAWVIDMIWNGALKRIVILNGKITEIGEVNYADNDAVGYDITITALPDTSGNCSYEYTKDSGASL